jgi:hypothetical protein
MKVVINRCHGGFGLSDAAFSKLLEAKGIVFETRMGRYSMTEYYHAGHVGEDDFYISPYDIVQDRSDADLVRIVEDMGEVASGRFAELKVVDVPDDVEWQVEEYDGIEWVAEKHRIWS